jgi:hypothetical protein
MRPINVSLDATTWELAKKKTNFSQWVRNQLRSEDNKISPELQRLQKTCVLGCGRTRFAGMKYCAYHVARGYGEEEE